MYTGHGTRKVCGVKWTKRKLAMRTISMPRALPPKNKTARNWKTHLAIILNPDTSKLDNKQRRKAARKKAQRDDAAPSR